MAGSLEGIAALPSSRGLAASTPYGQIMSSSGEDDESLAQFLETEILSEEDRTMPSKRMRLTVDVHTEPSCNCSPSHNESGVFSRIPCEIFHNILKLLSSEDLVSCSRVCKVLSSVASDECLWRRLYFLRWGPLSSPGKLRACPWKKLYIQRDKEDMVEFARNTPPEFREYYIQMQVAKRSQAPLPSQVDEGHVGHDKTMDDHVSIWRTSRGLKDEAVSNHVCSGKTCSYSKIGDAFICEKTGRVHVCDEMCRETVLDPDGLLVCTISGLCFDRLLSPSEEETASEQQQGVVDEVEPFMGSGRFARAYLLGYNCADEKELNRALWFC